MKLLSVRRQELRATGPTLHLHLFLTCRLGHVDIGDQAKLLVLDLIKSFRKNPKQSDIVQRFCDVAGVDRRIAHDSRFQQMVSYVFLSSLRIGKQEVVQ